MITRNALITSIQLGFEDHGILTCYLNLDYGDGGHQSFGGYNIQTNAGTWIEKILNTVGVDEWSKLKGVTIRANLSSDGLDGRINSIGHIIKDQWFDPSLDLI